MPSPENEESRGSRGSRDSWDARTYGHYAHERARPFHDLLARVAAADPTEVVDLGCGAGSGLSTMAHRWPGAHFVGVDSSVDMLAAADGELAELGKLGAFADVTLTRAEAETWAPEAAVDVLVSNALLQWIPNHAQLLSKMAGWLSPRGWLALQVPGNFDAPSHTLLRQLADSAQWAARLGGVPRGDHPVFDAAGYFRILTGAGLLVDAWETTYLHVLTGPDPVLDWTSGTALRPVLAVLTETEAAEFAAQYGDLLREAYPADEAGRVLFRFRRIFAVAHTRAPSLGRS